MASHANSGIDTSLIESLKNYTVVINFGVSSFSINIPFTADKFTVQGFILADDDAADSRPLPIFTGDNAGGQAYELMAGNVIAIESNLAPDNLLCVSNMTNTINPVYTHWNNSRQQFGGSYTFQARNMVDGSVMTDGKLILKFEFIRYATR